MGPARFSENNPVEWKLTRPAFCRGRKEVPRSLRQKTWNTICITLYGLRYLGALPVNTAEDLTLFGLADSFM